MGVCCVDVHMKKEICTQKKTTTVQSFIMSGASHVPAVDDVPDSCKAAGCNGHGPAATVAKADKAKVERGPKGNDSAIQQFVQAMLQAPAGGGPGTAPFNAFCAELAGTARTYQASCAAEEEKKRDVPQKVFELQQTVKSLTNRLELLEKWYNSGERSGPVGTFQKEGSAAAVAAAKK